MYRCKPDTRIHLRCCTEYLGHQDSLADDFTSANFWECRNFQTLFVVVHIHTSSSGTIHKPLAMFLRQQGTLII